ncbi:MAG: InlB B-repeat-containing protein [Clostridia bacterium]|nr:InlB B-repeat-containing protein [Clostridia bacterium]
MMKRLLSFLLAIVMILSFIPTAVFASEISNAVSKKLANPFKDVKENDWFYYSVQYSRVNGFFNGVSNTNFDPNGTMTRGMFVTVLGRMAGVDTSAYKGKSAFADVSENMYYAPYVAWAAKHGITTGTGNGNFSPDLVINRQSMATFLVRYFESFNVAYETDANITTLPADIDKVASWAQDAVIKLWKNGLLNGDGTNFNPKSDATRAQNAAIATRADEVVEVWYKEPGVPSDRVKIDPATGLPFEKEDTSDEEDEEPVVPVVTRYTVTYTDGVADEVIFKNQSYRVVRGSVTPAFEGTPKRDGYVFAGWAPEVRTYVTSNVTYTALWTPVTPDPVKYTVKYTDGVVNEEIFADVVYTVASGSKTPQFEYIPIRSGYTFIGWNPQVASTVTENVTYTAQWEATVITPDPVTFTVIYTDGVADEDIFVDQVYTREDGKDTPAFEGTPSREGYIFKGWSPSVSATVTASVTYTAQWEAEITAYAVNFYDGDKLIETLYADKDQPLGAVPSVQKSSKANAVLLGYFVDPAFSQPFYAENPVTSNMNVYAKYEDMGTTEVLNFTSFAQMDQPSDISFEIVGEGAPEAAVTLEVKDGSDPVELAFEATADGYTVSAPVGFNEGASYQLHLADGWNFKEKPETIRTASFSIAMEEVENLQMNDEIKYIQDTDEIDYAVGGNDYDVLTQSLITAEGGSFNYDGEGLTVGDIVCIYVGTHPCERVGNSDVLDPAVYVKVSNIKSGKVEFAQLGEEDQQDLYNVPENFPITVDALPTESTGKVNISALDKEVFAMTGDFTLANALDEAKAVIGVGDFITLYVSKETIASDSHVCYGEITAYDSESGEITYKKIEKQVILDSMDLYANIELEGDDYITEEEKVELEEALLYQVAESGFAEDAAFILADIVSETDGFKNNEKIRDFIITGEDGEELTDEELELLNLGTSFELSDDIKLTVELITKGDQLHFKGGVQLAIGIEAEFEVELEDDDTIKIELSATFVEEVMISPKVKGEIVYYELFGCIPIPNGVKVGATIDVKNFTAFSFEAVVYTVAAEDELGWDAFKEKAEKFVEDLGIEIPEELLEGVETVKDLVNKAKELEELADSVKEDYDKYMGYLEDAQTIWAALEDNDLTSKEEWNEFEEAFGSTSIASDMMEMMNLTNETGLSTEYYDSVEALMERYSEMIEQESDWVTLIKKQMFMAEANILGLVIGFEAEFVVRADMSLAIGSNLEYEVGKRYEFWFKIGLFKPSAGSSTMDLLDERFAFQFYVMGRLGLRAGVQAEFYVGIGTGDLASVGIYAELGPYIKLYGFFVYEYTKYRPANTDNWTKEEMMMGALYFEFGLYFILGFEAEALGLFEYSHDFLDEEIPLLEMGDKKYYYQFDYEPEEGELVLVTDEDANSTNGVTMTLPTELIGLKVLNLVSGRMGVEALDYEKYNFTVSNPNFVIDPKTGVITVNVPEGIRYMECDLNVTYKHGKLAFSTFDMNVTIPLVWTNMSTDDLTQYYTASVRVGNDADGYETVWTKRVLKNKEFDLPAASDPDNTIEGDIPELIGWNDYKHVMGDGYGDLATTGLTIIDNTTYDFNIDYKTYSVTVNGIQKADGSTESRTYYADFGESFDFSDLNETGTNIDGNYTIFSGLTSDATVRIKVGKDENGDPIYEYEPYDLSKAIDTKFASLIENGINIEANYTDNSVTATFSFSGIDHEKISAKLRRGNVPSLDEVEAIVSDFGMAIKEIYPAIGAIKASTEFKVVCGELVGEKATISFVENGGDEVDDITKVIGSIIGALPTPVRSGYVFEGWYSDEDQTVPFNLTKMPEDGAVLYAKWSADNHTVTFHVNGGNALEESDASKTVSYGMPYGELPRPERTGYAFIGWFTATEGGEEITSESIYNLTGNQTLYAQWRKLKEISADSFSFNTKNYTYSKGVPRLPGYGFGSDGSFSEDEFKMEFIAEGYESEGYVDMPVEAGTWGVKVTRPADDYYAKFEQFYPGVIVIEKATRSDQIGINLLSGLDLTNVYLGKTENSFSYLNLYLLPNDLENPDLENLYNYDNPSSSRAIVDADPDMKITLRAYPSGTTLANMTSKEILSTSATQSAFSKFKLSGLEPSTSYVIIGQITNDRNYTDCYFSTTAPLKKYTDSFATTGAPTGSWYDHTEEIAIDGVGTYTITTAGQLAWIAKQIVDQQTNFNGYTFKLGADIDLSEHLWTPIGVRGQVKVNNMILGIGNFAFKGSFNGNGYTISGLYSSGTYCGGLFGCVTGSGNTISNVTLVDSYVYGGERAAGIAGYVTATKGDPITIQNCVSHAVVKSGGSDVGGIVGYTEYVSIQSCVNFGRINGNETVGGIVGYVNDAGELTYPNVVDCVNYGKITGGSNYHFGGIVGYVVVGRIVNSANFGKVYASGSSVGGVTGEHDSNKNAKTINCINYAYVSSGSGSYTASFIGRNKSDDGIVSRAFYNKSVNSLKASGTKNGSEDENDNLDARPFTKIDETLRSNLNGWSGFDSYGATKWKKDNNGNGYIPESVYDLLYSVN